MAKNKKPITKQEYIAQQAQQNTSAVNYSALQGNRMYHYSPVTGRVDVCNAASPNTCPYRSYFHSRSPQEVQEYADRENRNWSRLTDKQKRYFDKDWMMSSEDYPGFSSETTAEDFKVTQYVLEYLGFSENEWSYINQFKKIYMFPKTKRAIQTHLNIPDNLDRVFRDMNKYMEDGTYERVFTGLKSYPDGTAEIKNINHSATYEKWDLMPYVEYAKKTGSVQMDKEIEKRAPSGKWGYSLTDCWRDWTEIKKYKKEIWEVEKGSNTFYIYACNE